MEQLIVSVDIGLPHFAFVACICVLEEHVWWIKSIHSYHMFDIRQFTCGGYLECHLSHEKCAVDYVAHLEKNYPVFKQADCILVEQQPPRGLMGIQECLHYTFRKTVKMVAPRSIHAAFGILKYTYEQRKEWTTAFATSYLSLFHLNLQDYDRKHDIADALCQLVYYLLRQTARNCNGKSKYFINPLHPLLDTFQTITRCIQITTCHVDTTGESDRTSSILPSSQIISHKT
jgi:hypothetical protein